MCLFEKYAELVNSNEEDVNIDIDVNEYGSLDNKTTEEVLVTPPTIDITPTAPDTSEVMADVPNDVFK